MAKGRGQGERAKGSPTLSSHSIPRLFSSVPHFALLSTICPLRLKQASSQWARQFFSNVDSSDLQMSIQEHLTFLKAHTHAATIPALASVKRHCFLLFSVLLQRKFFDDLFLMMVFHRRSKRVKIFSETFLTKYLYKRDSNTSKRTCILIHNYLKEKTREKKESVLIS